MKLVDSGDKLPKEVYNEFLEHVVTGIVCVTHLLEPGLYGACYLALCKHTIVMEIQL